MPEGGNMSQNSPDTKPESLTWWENLLGSLTLGILMGSLVLSLVAYREEILLISILLALIPGVASL